MTKSVIHDTGIRSDKVRLKGSCYPRKETALWLALSEVLYYYQRVSESDQVQMRAILNIFRGLMYSFQKSGPIKIRHRAPLHPQHPLLASNAEKHLHCHYSGLLSHPLLLGGPSEETQ